MEETKKVTTEEEIEKSLEEDFDDFEDEIYTEEDLKMAVTINKVKKGAKKVGKIALVVTGVAVLGIVGVGIAACVAKANEEKQKNDRSDNSYGRDYSNDYNREYSYSETDYSSEAAETGSTETEAA